MGWAVALQAIGTVISVASGMSQAKAAKQAGIQAQIAENYKAAQMDQAAGQEVAAAQRKRDEELHRAQLVASRALAVAGKGGGGVTDPTVVNLISDIQGEGAYRGMVAIYDGEERARQLRQGGATARYQGDIYAAGGAQRASALRTGAIGSGIIGAGSLYAKYGPRSGPGPEQPPAPVEDRMDPRFS